MLKLLLMEFSGEELFVDQDGDLGIEYYNGEDMISIRIADSGVINYAGVFERERFSGKCVFDGNIPKEVYKWLRLIFH